MRLLPPKRWRLVMYRHWLTPSRDEEIVLADDSYYRFRFTGRRAVNDLRLEETLRRTTKHDNPNPRGVRPWYTFELIRA